MPARPYHISCHVYLGYTIYHSMPSQAIPYTMPCPPGTTIYNAMSARPCPPGHTVYPAIPSRPYHIPCPADHPIYHVIPARPYHIPCHVGRGSSRPSSRNGKSPNGHVTRCTIVMVCSQGRLYAFCESYYLLFISGKDALWVRNGFTSVFLSISKIA